MNEAVRKRPTISSVAKMAAAGEAFACLTCYDATMARWLARAGVHVLLVGDTASEMVLGFRRTVDMPLDVLVALTAGVRRGAESGGGAVVMADMPFLSYHLSPDEAVRNAGRFLVEGQADIVKLEADAGLAPLVARMVGAGIAVCGHVGSRPQRAAVTGGYASAGRTRAEADKVVADARAMQDAGCSMLLVEAVPEAVAAEIVALAKVPVIGIGAGPACHGQVLVLQDLLGMTDKPPPFVAPVAALGAAVQAAGEAWVRRVAERGVGPSPYAMRG